MDQKVLSPAVGLAGEEQHADRHGAERGGGDDAPGGPREGVAQVHRGCEAAGSEEAAQQNEHVRVEQQRLQRAREHRPAAVRGPCKDVQALREHDGAQGPEDQGLDRQHVEQFVHAQAVL